LKFNNPEGFNIEDVAQYRSAVVWLEDQKIRHYKVEDRADLRIIRSSNWEQHFHKYLKDLECPLDLNDKHGIMDWLLGWAVHLVYDENALKYQEKLPDKATIECQTPVLVTANPLDNLAFNSEEFIEGVNNLAKELSITRHPDHLVTLKAICELITSKMHASTVENSAKVTTGKLMPLNEIELGFEVKDPVLKNAAKVLRLLFINDIRDLQTKINEVMVAVQTITANPKTDSSLGKVGH